MILPFIVLRRLDQAIEATRDATAQVYETGQNRPKPILEKTLLKASGMSFFNISPEAMTRKKFKCGKKLTMFYGQNILQVPWLLYFAGTLVIYDLLRVRKVWDGQYISF